MKTFHIPASFSIDVEELIASALADEIRKEIDSNILATIKAMKHDDYTVRVATRLKP